jgi:hypothetical protein
MKNVRCILGMVIPGILLTLAGCPGEDVSPDHFRLTVQDVVSDNNFRVSLLTVYYPQATCISVDSGDFHHKIYADKARNARQGIHPLPLAAAWVTDAESKKAYVQTHIVGGLNLESVSPETNLEECFSVSAKEGSYPLNTPITIAQLRGRPVTLVVGKPTL